MPFSQSTGLTGLLLETHKVWHELVCCHPKHFIHIITNYTDVSWI